MEQSLPFFGDFRLILPDVSRGFRAHILASCFKRSLLFPLFKGLRLTTNMRLLALQQDTVADEEGLQLSKLLLDVWNESLPHFEVYRTKLPSSIKKKNRIKNICDAVFYGLDQNYKNTEWLICRAIIASKTSPCQTSTILLKNRFRGRLENF